MSGELDKLRAWIGRKETRHDVARAWPVAALAATLDRSDPQPARNDLIPPGWHWLYFLETERASELGFDGYTRRGGFLPPVPLPRRMWAGGRLEFLRGLRIGEALRRDSEVVAIEPKQGKSGDLLLVTVQHRVYASNELAVLEEHDIIYREAAKPTESPAQPQRAPASAEWRRQIAPDTVLLFRFSALIFNAHRIHFDVEYVKDQGYPALIVHGALQTLLMLDLCRDHGVQVEKLDYRARHPLFHAEPFTVNGSPAADGSHVDLWTANGAGNYGMTGTAFLR